MSLPNICNINNTDDLCYSAFTQKTADWIDSFLIEPTDSEDLWWDKTVDIHFNKAIFTSHVTTKTNFLKFKFFPTIFGYTLNITNEKLDGSGYTTSISIPESYYEKTFANLRTSIWTSDYVKEKNKEKEFEMDNGMINLKIGDVKKLNNSLYSPDTYTYITCYILNPTEDGDLIWTKYYNSKKGRYNYVSTKTINGICYRYEYDNSLCISKEENNNSTTIAVITQKYYSYVLEKLRETLVEMDYYMNGDTKHNSYNDRKYVDPYYSEYDDDEDDYYTNRYNSRWDNYNSTYVPKTGHYSYDRFKKGHDKLQELDYTYSIEVLGKSYEEFDVFSDNNILEEVLINANESTNI